METTGPNTVNICCHLKQDLVVEMTMTNHRHPAAPMMSQESLQGSEAAFSALHAHTPFTHLRKQSQVSMSSSVTQGFSIQLCSQSGNWQCSEVLFPSWHIKKEEVCGLQRFTQLSHRKS